VLAALYVLSAGPAAWFVNRTGIGVGTFEVVYGPLEWFAHNSSLGKGIDSYVHLFIDDREQFDVR